MTDGNEAPEADDIPHVIRHFRAATRIAPERAAAYRALGHAFVQADDPAEAETAYRQVHALEAGDIETGGQLDSSPTVAGGVVCVGSKSGYVYALE